MSLLRQNPSEITLLERLETMKIEKDNISITYARPFSRTIPVRTPQSASRTEESKSWMSRGLVADRRSYLVRSSLMLLHAPPAKGPLERTILILLISQ